MNEIMTTIALVLSLGGTDVSQIGPLPDMSTCVELKKEVHLDISHSFEMNHPEGLDGSPWNLDGMYQLEDYGYDCVLYVTQDGQTTERRFKQ
jgi:hypothetical protein